MKRILKKALNLVFTDDSVAAIGRLRKKDRPLKKFTERELIQLESEIGVTIFGKKPDNVIRREFFNLDKDTWIWHEEIIDKNGQHQELTTRYEVQSKGILKVQPNYQYNYLEGQELQNFVLAVKEYYERVARQLYGRDPATGKKIEEILD